MTGYGGLRSREGRVQTGGWLLSPECSLGTWSGSSSLAPPPPQGRCVTIVPIFCTRKSRPRDVGELFTESLSLESRELAFESVSPEDCVPRLRPTPPAKEAVHGREQQPAAGSDLPRSERAGSRDPGQTQAASCMDLCRWVCWEHLAAFTEAARREPGHILLTLAS